jgi:hypothetical protein
MGLIHDYAIVLYKSSEWSYIRDDVIANIHGETLCRSLYNSSNR